MTVARRVSAVVAHDASGKLLGPFSRGGLDVPYVETAARYLAQEGIDEVWLHLEEPDARGVAGLYEPVRNLSSSLFLPVVAWGSVTSGPDARILIGMGADRVVVDVSSPDVDPALLISQIANAVGPDQTVAALDVRRAARGDGFSWEQCERNGASLGRDATDLVEKLAEAGAGEIVLLPRFENGLAAHASDLVERVVSRVWCQIVSAGDEREPADVATPLLLGADGILTSTMLRDGTLAVSALKEMLTDYGVSVRPAVPPYVLPSLH